MSLKATILKWLLYPLFYRIVKMPGKSFDGPVSRLSDDETRMRQALERHVNTLSVAIGERSIARYDGMLKAVAYIEQELTKCGYKVERQNVVFEGMEMPNLIVEKKGATRPDEIVVIGAHYDTVVGTPGADDNASGVAALILLAAMFSQRTNDRTIRFVAFANEEHPGGPWDSMGSYAYARRCRERGENVTGMLSLEMLGVYSDAPGSQNYPSPFSLYYPTVANFIGFVANTSSRNFVRKCVGAFRKHARIASEGVAAPERIKDIGRSDHWSFWQFGYKGVMVTDTSNFRYPTYHTPGDTPDKLDFQRMTLVVAGLTHVLGDIARV